MAMLYIRARGGQTALEYLLIIVVSVSMIVAVVMWMQNAAKTGDCHNGLSSRNLICSKLSQSQCDSDDTCEWDSSCSGKECNDGDGDATLCSKLSGCVWNPVTALCGC